MNWKVNHCVLHPEETGWSTADELHGLLTTFYFKPNPDWSLHTWLKLKQGSCKENCEGSCEEKVLSLVAEKFTHFQKIYSSENLMGNGSAEMAMAVVAEA